MSEEKKATVLLLSAPIGAGHRLAAEAIAAVLQEDPNLEVIHGNVFSFFPSLLGKAFLKSYLWILNKCPWLYASAYKWGNKDNGSLWLRSIINHILAFLAKGFLDRTNPDVVISTHATPAGIIGIYKRNHPQIWQGAVITDYTIHRWWQNPGIDTYFIANKALLSKIKTEAEIIPTGIPIRKEFSSLPPKQELRKSYGWEEQEQVCLLMGGGEGLLPMHEILKLIIGLHQPQLRIIALAGSNRELVSQLRGTYANNNRVEIYGFRQDIPHLMSAADMIISKAGGLSSAEILAAGLNYIIYKPLPGQEQNNARFLQENCAVKIADNLQELEQEILTLLAQKQKNQTQEFGHPEAVYKICEVIKAHLK